MLDPRLAITRLPGAHAGRSRVVSFGDLVFTVAVAREKSPSMYEQTKGALAAIDEGLAMAGTDKSRILTALVYIADMAEKAAMNRAWMEWVDAAAPPMRACLGVALEGRDLVEIVVTAARRG
jgi:enamine deaminase RidA (YjgF/YER057c/UK114 family)